MDNKKEAKRILPHSNFFPKNMRGQGMSTNAIILIILGIVVLVVLILGFTMGWGKIAPWLSSNNVDTIVTACEASCAVNGEFDFCMVGRTLKAGDVKLNKVTCNYLAEKETQYGISKCPSIVCEDINIVTAAEVEDLPGFCPEDKEITIQAMIDNSLESYTCTLTE